MNEETNKSDGANTNLNSDPAAKQGNTIKDPDEWTTGAEPMTGAQRSYIETLVGSSDVEEMTKAEASKFIDESRQQKGDTVENTVKDPAEWATGEEPMTGAQRSYLKTLSDEAGETMDENLSKAGASMQIEALQQKTGRGTKTGE